MGLRSNIESALLVASVDNSFRLELIQEQAMAARQRLQGALSSNNGRQPKAFLLAVNSLIFAYYAIEVAIDCQETNEMRGKGHCCAGDLADIDPDLNRYLERVAKAQISGAPC